jgi:hypothetical protein
MCWQLRPQGTGGCPVWEVQIKSASDWLCGRFLPDCSPKSGRSARTAEFNCAGLADVRQWAKPTRNCARQRRLSGSENHVYGPTSIAVFRRGTAQCPTCIRRLTRADIPQSVQKSRTATQPAAGPDPVSGSPPRHEIPNRGLLRRSINRRSGR